MSDTTPLSIFEPRTPRRRWTLDRKIFAALLLVFIGLPTLLAGLVILLMILGDGPR